MLNHPDYPMFEDDDDPMHNGKLNCWKCKQPLCDECYECHNPTCEQYAPCD